jgi:DNA-binding NarL/FixJ family response regulator
MGGIEATRRIAHDSPHVAILVLTMLADDESVLQPFGRAPAATF